MELKVQQNTLLQGAGDFWDKKIYPGMREAIIGTNLGQS